MSEKPKLALLAPPFTAEAIAELFAAITGQPVTSAEMDEMRAALAAGCKGEADADLPRMSDGHAPAIALKGSTLPLSPGVEAHQRAHASIRDDGGGRGLRWGAKGP